MGEFPVIFLDFHATNINFFPEPLSYNTYFFSPTKRVRKLNQLVIIILIAITILDLFACKFYDWHYPKM